MGYHRTKDQRERDRERVFHWRSMHVPFEQIAKQLGVSKTTVLKDHAVALRRFREHWQCEEGEKRERILEGILAVAREAWDNYRALKTFIAAEADGGKKADKLEKMRMDRNLSLVLRAMKQMSDLLGTDAPKRIYVTDNQEQRKKYIEILDGVARSIEGPPLEATVVDAEDVDLPGGNGTDRQ